MTPNTSNWLHGLFAALIGGGASAVVSGFTVSALAPESFNLHEHVGHTLELMATLFIVNGVLSAMAYLKQSPLPVETVQVTATTTQTTTVTATPQEKI